MPPLLAAFRTLPSRTQGLLWYGVLEREPAERTAVLLGLTPQDVAYGTGPALTALARAALRARLAASDDPRCADFRRLIEESVRPDSPRESADLHAHMTRCAHCTAAYEEQCALRDDPRTALAEGLLPWAGTAYAAREADRPAGPALAAPRLWPPSRRFALASAALGVALAPLLLMLVSQGGSSSPPRAAAPAGVPSAPPPAQVTVTATVSAPPSSSPPASVSAPASPSPSSTAGRAPTRTARPTPSPPAAPPRTGFRAGRTPRW